MYPRTLICCSTLKRFHAIKILNKIRNDTKLNRFKLPVILFQRISKNFYDVSCVFFLLINSKMHYFVLEFPFVRKKQLWVKCMHYFAVHYLCIYIISSTFNKKNRRYNFFFGKVSIFYHQTIMSTLYFHPRLQLWVLDPLKTRTALRLGEQPPKDDRFIFQVTSKYMV